jgi:integrase/recombinase XerD
MFEQLFKCPHALARHRHGPLVEERCRYLVHCAERQMSPRTLRDIAIYTLAVAGALHLADRPDELITRAEIEAEADRWANRQTRPPMMCDTRLSRLRFTGQACRWLAFLGRLQSEAVAHRPYSEHIAEFADHMQRDRGLSPRTAEICCAMAQEFLARIAGDGVRLETLTVAEVDEFLARKVRVGGYARASVRHLTSGLRAFFRYAEGRGWCRAGLAVAIMAPRMYTHEGFPSGLPWDAVSRALAVAEGDHPAGIRDRALLMLLAVYGLRAGEVVGLHLEDFDWQLERLTVRRGKRQKPRAYPLCGPVGDAIIRYIREARPLSARREVFLTVRAPFRPMTRGALWQSVSRRLHALGVPLPRYGPHALRHTCATHLLERGLSLKEIGDHLGHRSPEATRIYAKVDLAGLRAVGDFELEGLL